MNDTLSHRGGELHILREIARAHQAMMAGFTRGVGLPSSRFALLRLLAVEGPAGPVQLARRLGIDAAAVTRLIGEMERERLVARCTDDTDGRRKAATLTAKGSKLFETVHRRSHQLEHRMAQSLGAEKIAAATATLTELCTFLEAYDFNDR